MCRKQCLWVLFLLEVLGLHFPSNTDVFYKITFCVTKATGNFQLNADGKVFLTSLSGARMCPNVYEIYKEAVHVANLFYIIMNINYCVDLAPSLCFGEQIFPNIF